MKTAIHPEYMTCAVHCSCGNEFETRSTVSMLRLELCSECHPFYTGKQKLVDTGGRVERFQRRLAQTAKVQKKLAAPKVAPQYGTTVPTKAEKKPAAKKSATKKVEPKKAPAAEPALESATESESALESAPESAPE